MNNITIGTDAEIFLAFNNKPISAINLIGGTKDEPKSIGNECFVQEDNVLAEFNIPPVNNAKDFLEKINYCKDWIKNNIPEDLSLHFKSSEKLNTVFLSDLQALEFGCKPDCIVDLFDETDSYTEDEHEAQVLEKTKSNIRTSGFHIHIGYENSNVETNRELVKMFEKYVTIPLISSDDDAYDRRSMYGPIGSYRNKEYGVECRSLGGYFLKNDSTILDVWNRLTEMLEAFMEGERVSKEEFKQIKENINKLEKVTV